MKQKMGNISGGFQCGFFRHYDGYFNNKVIPEFHMKNAKEMLVVKLVIYICIQMVKTIFKRIFIYMPKKSTRI